jgi:hypothetical protein
VVSLGLTALLTHSGVGAWWLLPLGVVAMLALSVFGAARHARQSDPPQR